MKKCKHCHKRLYFWNRKVRQYHYKCAVPAFMALKEYLEKIEYIPYFKDGDIPKPVTTKEHKELRKDMAALLKVVEKKLYQHVKKDYLE